MNKQLFAQTAPPPLRGRGTGWGQIRRGYLWSASVRSTDLFFPIIEGKTIFVSSTAKRQRGLQRGKLGSPLPCFASFCRSKRKAPAASGANYAFAKGSTPPIGDHKLSPAGQAHSLGLCKRPRPAARRPPAWPKNLLSAFLGGKAASCRARMARKKRFRLVNLPVLRYDKGSTPS